MKMTIVLGLAALAAATGAFANDKDDAKASAGAEKLVCHSDKVTGSLARVNKICMTKAEWAALSLRNKTDVEDLQKLGSLAPPSRDPTQPSNMGSGTIR